ncbi:hypothetical protein SKAU_G00071560 [Synaphobranchus kaupii]|uniref:Interleukin-7 n=1 Tax=Synaphobranchus kaupii TaxID=118154 RepID=A0A9Q1JAK2_SYNKA|nr:hypothetical protein SKAU_G00071560 [Synaphobranchus kaupii]
MTNVPQQALFGSYLLALLLLPLAYSCESTRPKAEVMEDYKCVIHPLLQSIENNITLLGGQECGEMKQKHLCEEDNERGSIHKMVCSIPFKNPKKTMSKIKCDLRNLTVNIKDSLNCSCPRNEDDNPSKFNCKQPHHRNLRKERLCNLLSIIKAISSCYKKLTNKNS